ncbi:hypothetical protein [Microvirga arsenatis]|nr:hypothetical protein [Microvirga arsenatis]
MTAAFERPTHRASSRIAVTDDLNGILPELPSPEAIPSAQQSH